MDYLLHLLTSAALIIPTVLGFNIVLGKGKILHFGHAGTALVAAYSFILSMRAFESWTIGILVAILCTAAISLLFAEMSLKLESDGFGILSIAVHLALVAIVLNSSSLTRGALGIPGIPRMPGLSSPVTFAVVTVLIALLWMALCSALMHSSFGRSLQALSEHRHHAEALGIRRRPAYQLAFLLAGAGTLVTNIFSTQYIGLLHPSDYGFPALVFLVMCVVAGGPGRVRGVAFATVCLVFLKEGLRFVPIAASVRGPMLLLLFGLILSVAVFLRRNTLFPQSRTV